MDNMKTGALIKALRKEKGLTQQTLADQLHITDRAVSKWERGICAPDIATLEPLASILGVTVTELICGERMEQTAQFQEVEEKVQNAIEYSNQEMKVKESRFRKLYIAIAVAAVCIAGIVCAAVLWWNGYGSIVARAKSPGGLHTLTVYDRDVAVERFSNKEAVTVRLSGEKENVTVYENCRYGDIWWSPNSNSYLLQLELQGETKLIMTSLEDGGETDLSAALERGVATNETAFDFFRGEVIDNTAELDVKDLDFRVVHWDARGQTIMVYYTFTDSEEKLHDGYLRYDCGTGAVYVSRLYVW